MNRSPETQQRDDLIRRDIKEMLTSGYKLVDALCKLASSQKYYSITKPDSNAGERKPLSAAALRHIWYYGNGTYDPNYQKKYYNMTYKFEKTVIEKNPNDLTIHDLQSAPASKFFDMIKHILSGKKRLV
jgi:hypothetical protein